MKWFYNFFFVKMLFTGEKMKIETLWVEKNDQNVAADLSCRYDFVFEGENLIKFCFENVFSFMFQTVKFISRT